ncbi:MAG: alkaline phosphatase family protein [Nocardioidaceae bacterium]
MRARPRILTLLAACALLAGCTGGGTPSGGPTAQHSPTGSASVPGQVQPQSPAPSGAAATQRPGDLAAVRHVFVVNLENKSFDQTFGPGSAAPYLARTLPAKGQLLTQYYAVAHHSLPNYIAQISGQGPSKQTQGDCPRYTEFMRDSIVPPDQAVGDGCVYPEGVDTVAGQLEGHGYTWRGYMQDMGRPCRHPALNGVDTSQQAQRGDQYATRHDPFVYFREITGSPGCARDVVDLSRLPKDLASVAGTPNLSYISPDLCSDGHDQPCVDGRPGGLVSADAWLRTWVPQILASPAFGRDGLLVVTFDEAESDAAACCGEGATPNTDQPGITGPGGGRVGAVLVSPFVRPGTRNATSYNHFSLLRTIEDAFGLPALGYAQEAHPFGADVFGS